MNGLKPCPYCGGEARMNRYVGKRFDVVCLECLIYCAWRDTEEEAVATWNELVDAVNAYRRTCKIVLREGYTYCSTCKAHVEGYYEDATDEHPMRFCPSCGARVVGE